jgi:hypothetical protein
MVSDGYLEIEMVRVWDKVWNVTNILLKCSEMQGWKKKSMKLKVVDCQTKDRT